MSESDGKTWVVGGATTSLSPAEEAALAIFVDLMLNKLRANAHKGGWKSDSAGDLFRLLREEVGELGEALHLGATPAEIMGEAADVANFAMMIADVASQALSVGERPVSGSGPTAPPADAVALDELERGLDALPPGDWADERADSVFRDSLIQPTPAGTTRAELWTKLATAALREARAAGEATCGAACDAAYARGHRTGFSRATERVEAALGEREQRARAMAAEVAVVETQAGALRSLAAELRREGDLAREPQP